MEFSKKSDYIIVGGGVVGLSIAYNLAKYGVNVEVFERGYIGCGNSTRNAGNARAHFFSREGTIIAWESLKLMYRLSRELKFNTLFTRRGYLWLLYSEAQVKGIERIRGMWRSLGVPEGRMLSVEELRREYPFLNLKGVVGGFLGEVNGRFHHDAVVRGYWKACSRLGVKTRQYTNVEKLIVKSGRVVGVETESGSFYAEKGVVVAAGPWTRTLLEPLSVEVPIEPIRKEIIVTEPIKIRIKPLIICVKTQSYVQQTLRGEVLGSTATPLDIPTWSYQHTYQHPIRTAKALVELIPVLSTLNFMRQWAGQYDVTPDHNPILGRVEEYENLYVAAGFSGHGFMLAPAVGKYMAILLEEEKLHPIIEPFSLNRFREGKLIREELIIG